MEINGRGIASSMYEEMQVRVEELVQQGVTPHMVVLLVGDDPSSISYIKQKKKWLESIGGKITILPYASAVSEQILLAKIEELNTDPLVHGIIVQLPLPEHLSEETLTQAVDSTKDIDGFKIDSPYPVPIAESILNLLASIHKTDTLAWLKEQQVVVIGKGKTAGEPIIAYLTELGVAPVVVDHETENPDQLTKNADIIITCVGKPRMVTAEKVKMGVILLGVGIHHEDRILKGDYDEEEMKEIASWYSPTPGGVGPVNVACLIKNLVKAAE